MTHGFVMTTVVVSLAIGAICDPAFAEKSPPKTILDPQCLRDFAPGAFKNVPLIVQLAEGAFLAYMASRDQGQPCVVVRSSGDGGQSWSDESIVFRGYDDVTEALVDRDGEIHLFFIRAPDSAQSLPTGGEESRPLVGQLVKMRLDIWYTRSHGGRATYDMPRMIWKGYTGALNSVIQTRHGRILLPFSFLTNRSWGNRGGGFADFTFAGQYDSTLIYSDDGGTTWKAANNLSIPVPDIVSAYGAVEPVVVELKNKIWMLIRGQTGRFYDSWSADDGATWAKPKSTDIISSDSPAGLVRLSDGRLVLLWNCCLRYPYAYGGRQVLHAAISSDEGKTWRGYREVARDRFRNEPPPKTGDHGTAYPFPIATRDDKILFRTGQGEGRVEIKLLDPLYLYQARQETDWQQKLEDWSIYGTKGVGLGPAEGSTTGQALTIRRVDTDFPSAAVWNFPMGSTGTLRMRVKLPRDGEGFRIGLTDHYSPPFDEEDMYYNVFNVKMGGPDGISVPTEQWGEVQLEWDTNTGSCTVSTGLKEICTIKASRVAHGICYLRIMARSAKPEKGGLWLDSMEVDLYKSFQK